MELSYMVLRNTENTIGTHIKSLKAPQWKHEEKVEREKYLYVLKKVEGRTREGATILQEFQSKEEEWEG